MKTIISLLFMIIVITGCQKQINEGPGTDKAHSVFSEKSLQHVYDDSPGNPANPYDSVGILHNILLDTVWSYVQRTGDTSRAGKNSTIIRYFKERSGLDVSIGMRRTSALIRAEYSAGKEAECLSKYLKPEALRYILKALDLFKTVKEEKDCILFIPAVMALEGEIAGARTLTGPERMKILMVTSVMRHSFWYWKKAVWENTQPAPQSKLFGFLKEIVRFLAYSQMDAIGVIYGLFPYEGMEQLGADAAGESAMAVWYIDQWL